MRRPEKIAQDVFKQCANVNKFGLTRSIDKAIKEAVDEALSDPLIIHAMQSNEGYYRCINPDGMEYKVYKHLIEKLPVRWEIILPGAGSESEKTYDKSGRLLSRYWGLEAIKTQYDLILVI